MNQRLTEIEGALLRVDSATFQRLCDEYLFCQYGAEFRQITRTGTQAGKMQTVKGTPDTYVVLPSGQYVLIEYTKQQRSLAGKLHDDLAKCLDEAKTGLQPQQIDRITLAFAGRLTTEEDQALRQACPRTIRLELINLDSLALAIHNDFPQLARRYLGLPGETLQLLTPDEFIAAQERKSIGENNPLSNPFLHRSDDLASFLSLLNQHTIAILSGAPGVGKTKLALEALREFCKQNEGYTPICITNKFAPLLEDLGDLVRPGQKYLFLIDDANRQTPILVQTLEYLYAKRDVHFKVILTVRDYALNVVQRHLKTYQSDSYFLEKFTDEQINQLISAEPFGIRNPLFQQRIGFLANGNPRLAIMAARLAKKEQNILALNDATDLFVTYYDNLTDAEDNHLLSDPTRLKVLGLLAVFRQIDLLDESFCKQLSQAFGLSRDTFAAELSALEKDELADVYMNDQSLFKISDQNLATYAVFLAFIERKFLSVETLLTNFFEEYPHRIRDAFYGVLNVLDQQRTIADIREVTHQYFHSVREDDEKAFAFLEIFYFALPTETLAYLHQFAYLLPDLQAVWEENPWHGITGNTALEKRLTLLFHFLEGVNEHFETALELLLLIAKQNPKSSEEIVKKVNDRLSFRPDDTPYPELRQAAYFDFLINQASTGNSEARRLVVALVPSFLRIEFESNSSKGRLVTFTRLPLPYREPFLSFRESLWQFVRGQLPAYPQELRQVIYAYLKTFHRGEDKEYRQFDMERLIPLIYEYFSPNDFEDCHFAHEYVRLLEWKGIYSDEMEALTNHFHNQQYDFYLLMQWNRIRGQNAGDEIWTNEEEYKRKKQSELLENLDLSSEGAIDEFFNAVMALYSYKACEGESFDKQLVAILRGVADGPDKTLFERTIILFSQYDWPLHFGIPYVIHQIFGQIDCKVERWHQIFSGAAFHREEWKLAFWGLLAPEVITPFYAEQLILFYEQSTLQGLYFRDQIWNKYLPHRPTLYRDVLTALTKRYETKGIWYNLEYDFFSESISRFDPIADLPLLKKAYILQFGHTRTGHYDFDRRNLQALLTLDPGFLLEFVEAHYERQSDHISHPEIDNLGFIWQLEDSIGWAMKVIKLMKSKSRYDFLHGRYKSFFQQVLPNSKETVIAFLRAFVQEYHREPKEIESLTQALLEVGLEKEWSFCIREFLSINRSLSEFKMIDWAPHGGGGGADFNFDQMRADQLKQVVAQVRRMPTHLPYLGHIQHLEQIIGRYEKYADAERRRQFAQDD